MSTVTRPKVVHVRANPVEEKTNVFAQITVKIHSKQVWRQHHFLKVHCTCRKNNLHVEIREEMVLVFYACCGGGVQGTSEGEGRERNS